MDLACGRDAICARHHQVHEDDIRLVQGDHLHGFGAIGGFANQLEILVYHQEFGQAAPYNGMVIHEKNFDCHGYSFISLL